MTETRQVDVPVMREVFHVERVPASAAERRRSATRSSEKTVVVRRCREEEVEVTRRPRVRDELRVTKTPHVEERRVEGRSGARRRPSSAPSSERAAGHRQGARRRHARGRHPRPRPRRRAIREEHCCTRAAAGARERGRAVLRPFPSEAQARAGSAPPGGHRPAARRPSSSATSSGFGSTPATLARRGSSSPSSWAYPVTR